MVRLSETMKDILALGTGLLVLVIFSVWHPTGDFVSSPSYWGDEAVGVEKARNFLTYGRLDIAVAPDVLSLKPYATAAAGPLLTLPLAGFYSLFGIGLLQTRIYMLLWLIMLIGISYGLVRKLAGRRAALVSILLMATFSPLYANGKTATGDIPGFVALFLALYYLYARQWYVFGGVLLGIATTTKPSLYLPLVAVALIEIVLFRRGTRLKHCAAIVGGSLLILIPWMVSLVPRPDAYGSWREVYTFFKNPFPADALRVVDAVMMGDMTMLLHSTIAHYALLGCIAASAAWYTRARDDPWMRFVRFGVLYALAAFVLYLRSPGWIRYLIAGSFFLFSIFLPSLEVLLRERAWRHIFPLWTGGAIAVTLIALQAVHFIFFSWRTVSDAPIQDSAMVRQLVGLGETIGFMDVPTLASLVDSKQKYQVVRISGNTVLGKSPLAYDIENLPTYIFISANKFRKGENEFVAPYTHVLDRQYEKMTLSTNRYTIYKKK
ncbi:MAG: glycosyltransferase [Parcubacteria group bacterium Gr01-1014_29]|nr:MAG: glycosyltransferase [Parcubacteria group bacterium Gr01-1014_29]